MKIIKFMLCFSLVFGIFNIQLIAEEENTVAETTTETVEEKENTIETIDSNDSNSLLQEFETKTYSSKSSNSEKDIYLIQLFSC